MASERMNVSQLFMPPLLSLRRSSVEFLCSLLFISVILPCFLSQLPNIQSTVQHKGVSVLYMAGKGPHTINLIHFPEQLVATSNQLRFIVAQDAKGNR